MNSVKLCSLILCSALIMSNHRAQAFIITQADIENGLVIDQPGLWELSETVTFDVNHAIQVEVADVVIDFKGYAMQAQENGNNAIAVRSNNCQILNGIIRNTASSAISIATASGVTINDIEIEDCFSGIYIANSDYTTLSFCSISGAQDVGILAVNAPYTALENIAIKDSNSDGVVITGDSYGSSLNNVTVKNSSGPSGITISSDNAGLRSIILHKLAGDGLRLNGNDATVTLTAISSSGGHGCVVSGTGTTLQQCLSSANSGDGILLQNTAANTLIFNSQSSGNGHIGINNLGATSNTARYSLALFNVTRDLWRIVITY